MGQIIFYGFKGGQNLGNGKGIASSFSVLISALPDIGNLEAERVKDNIDFSTSELYAGSTKSKKIGGLQFSVVIRDVQKYSALKYYMNTVKLEVNIQNY